MNVVRNSLPTFIYWFSLTISAVASLFFLFFLLSEDIPAIINGETEGIFLALTLLAAIAGCILSFFKQKIGAITMIAGGIGLVFAIALQSGMAEFGMMVVYSVAYIFPGLFLLLMLISAKS